VLIATQILLQIAGQDIGQLTDIEPGERPVRPGWLRAEVGEYGQDPATVNAALEAGGVLVSDKVTLEFEISAIRTPDTSATASGSASAATRFEP
jgi:hypothetical protein